MSENEKIDELLEENQLAEDEVKDLTSTEVEVFEADKPATQNVATKEVAARSETGVVVSDGKAEDRENDYNYVRTNLYDVIEKGTVALEELVHLATQSQNPRAFEVVFKGVEALTESNEKIMEIHRRLKELEADSGNKSQNADTINNIVFQGTTDQLFDALEKRKDVIDAKATKKK